MAIPGFQIIIGDGLHFIMAGGSIIIITVGFGFREMSGDQHGLAGGRAVVTMVLSDSC